MNSFGRLFRVSIFGESHGPLVGVTLDGVPAGIALDEKSFEKDLNRRKSGKRGTTPRKESDLPEIATGLFQGRTTGAPLTVLFRNENTLSGDYANLVAHPRPSHSDWVAARKFGGFNDYRGGGHFSGRLTLGLVAAGVVAKKILGRKVKIESRIVEIDDCNNPDDFPKIVEEALRAQDSVGGIVECSATGVPPALGEPFFDSVESTMSHLLFSIPAVKGVEFGAGFAAAGCEAASTTTRSSARTARPRRTMPEESWAGLRTATRSSSAWRSSRRPASRRRRSRSTPSRASPKSCGSRGGTTPASRSALRSSSKRRQPSRCAT